MSTPSPTADGVFADFYQLRLTISYTTVDKLKMAIRLITHRCREPMKLSGNKSDLIQRIRDLMDRYRGENNVTGYSQVRRSLCEADSITFRVYLPAVAVGAPAAAAGATGATAPVASTSAASASGAVAGPNYRFYGGAHHAPASALATTPGLPGPKALASPVKAAPPQVRALLDPAPAMLNVVEAEMIAFRPSPFYTFEGTVMQPLVCARAAPNDRKAISGTIILTPSQRLRLAESRASPMNPQYSIRLFCASDEYVVPNAPYGNLRFSCRQPRGPAPVDFPLVCEAKINGVPLGGAKLRGIKKRENTTAAPDIGQLMVGNSNQPAFDLRAGSINRIEFVYVNAEKRYFLMASMVKGVSVSELVQRIKKGKFRSREDVVKSILKQNEDVDIKATSSILQLKCPLSFMRINTPTRSIGCSHLQCFDCESFLSMMEQTPSWNCPVCNGIIKADDCILDGYSEAILKEVPSSYDQVIVEIDGTWHTPDYKYGNAKPALKVEDTKPKLGERGKNNILILDDDDFSPPALHKPVQSRAGASGLISLSSSPTRSGTATLNGFSRPTPSLPTQPTRTATATAGMTIDLTLSDSEDDDDADYDPRFRNGGGGSAAATSGHKRALDNGYGDDERPGTRQRVGSSPAYF